ncbi:putative inorganic phosphate cotransporter [Hyposmocoma kahamanoa]|uniref:putative inorganic phosphate cotransporter n=1 Tax=Hyposmocoma kahamanoa TaxID=1477025 RepID=UPI000E6D6620|nr:putative inorganic phosphate cotransporter [Hyposmocoma kahamanoa]
MFVCMTSLIVVRSSMGVAVLAMTDKSRINDTGIMIYDWDKKTQGLILSSFFWGYVLMQVPAGLLLKRFGGKPILQVAVLSNALLCVLLPVLTAWGGWMVVCAIRLCVGLTQACLFPACHTLLGRWLPESERTKYIGFIYGGMQLGIIIGMPVSGLLAETKLGWPLIFYVMAGLMVVTALMWQFLTASTPGEHRWITHEEKEYIERGLNISSEKKSLRTPWKHIFTSIPIYAITIAHISVGTAFVLFFTEMPTYLEKALKISLRNSAALSGLPYAGMWLSGVVVGIISQKLYNTGVLSAVGCRKIFNSIGSIGVSIGLLILAYLGPQSRTIAVASLIFALTMTGFYISGYMLNHLDLSPNFAGLLLSLTNFVANLFSVVIPIFTSFALNNDPTDLNGWRTVFLTMAGTTLGCNLIYILFTTSDRQPWDDPDFENKKYARPEEMIPVINKKEDTTS